MSARDIHATPKSSKAIPTNTVTYKGRKIPARIDPNARLAYIVEIMAQSFETSEHHITLCLRDEADHLVTQSQLSAKVAKGEILKLAPSPTTEALAVITSFKTYLAQPASSHKRLPSVDQSSINLSTDGHTRDGISLKLALFNLQKYIKEEDFVVDFMLKGGVKMLVRMMEGENGLSGNSLAYALQGIRGLLEFEAGWTDIEPPLIDRILSILCSTSAQPNVLRPATAIVRKFVISAPHLQSGAPVVDAFKTPTAAPRRSKGKERADQPESEGGSGGLEKRFGFDAIWRRMESVGAGLDGEGIEMERVWRVVVKRLEGTGDLELVALTLGLINACFRSADHHGSPSYPALISLMEHLSLRKYVSRLMQTSSTNAVEPQILNFQARWTSILHRKRLSQVRPSRNPAHQRMLSEIWALAGLGTGMRDMGGWRRMGLGEEGMGDAEGEAGLFRDVGELGLECLHWYATHEENFGDIVNEQQARQADRRCPIGQASTECVKILCEHYKISQAGHVHPTHFQLFLLHFPRLHHIAMSLFLRMWHESESRRPDFSRLSNLVRSQIFFSLANESQATWLSLEQDLLESEYTVIRERQMEMLEKEDGMMAKEGVRGLREVLGREAYEVVSDQRIGCMLHGAWFNAATLLIGGVQATVRPNAARPLRFVRLSPNRKTIAWGDFASRPTTNPTYDSLRDRIEISNITSVQPTTSTAVNSRSQGTPSKLSFSLLSGPEMSLLDLDAVHSAQFSEWVDGIRVLRGEGGMRSLESGVYVKVLTEIALKVRLLDITGDGVELPDKVLWGQAPSSVDFCFAK